MRELPTGSMALGMGGRDAVSVSIASRLLPLAAQRTLGIVLFGLNAEIVVGEQCGGKTHILDEGTMQQLCADRDRSVGPVTAVEQKRENFSLSSREWERL